MSERINVIESPEFARTRVRLAADPIVQAMACELIADLGLSAALEMTGAETGRIPLGFMTSALAEYNRRGGTCSGHIGGVAEGMVKVLVAIQEAQASHTQASRPQSEQPRCPDCRVPVLDHQEYFGVHLADCGYWDDRCRRCHKLIPAGTAMPHRSDLCRSCGEERAVAAAFEQGPRP